MIRSRAGALTQYTAILLCLFMSLVGCCVRVSMVDIPPLAAHPPLAHDVAAHRGSPVRYAFPDNSIAAIESASQSSIPFIEIDVRLSQQGDLFLFHDGSLKSSNSFSPARLHGLPIGSLSREQRSEVFLDRNRSLTIPTFEAALSAMQTGSGALQVDLKGESDQLALRVLEVAQSMGLMSRVLIQVRSPDRVAIIRKSFPEARILARCVSPEALQIAIAQRVEYVELERWISSEAISAAHRAGIKVLINLATSRLDESASWEYFRSRGVDSIMSDRAAEHNASTPNR